MIIKGYVMASKMLIDGKKEVNYLYHEEPTNDQDSGWRLFCGEESKDYMANPENLGIYDLKTIMDFDPSVLTKIESTKIKEDDGFVAMSVSSHVIRF